MKHWLQKKYLIVVLIAFAATISITNYKGDVWEEAVRQFLYAVRNDSVPDFAVEHVDSVGVPWVYYPEQNGITAGKQYNATIVCNYAIAYYNAYLTTKDSAQLRYFKNCVDWLSNAMTINHNYALYYFNWQQPWYPKVKTPWTCGMTSGRAIEAFTYAFKQFNDTQYLAKAKLLVRGYYLPIEDGGFTFKEKQGWWYEENADTLLQTPRILDGHIYAISGLQVYQKMVQDDSVSLLIQQGLASLKHHLPEYDAGDGKIWYNAEKKLADKKYHRILTAQLKELWQTTGDDFYLKYYNKWSAPLKVFYLKRMVQQANISGLILFTALFLLMTIALFFSIRLFRQLSMPKH